MSESDFICYTHESWDINIRPAPATREWMDQTPESYAYRCLPLNIANAHGWEITTPAGFVVEWSGGMSDVDVKVHWDPGMPETIGPVSLFGSGTVTIHIPGLFRTPPGWNLMVGGTPNWFKDGIAPLTGIIETDWSPYTFTMNWKLTRDFYPVRFEAGDPICFIQPVRRDAFGFMNPKIVPLEHNPDYFEQHQDWSNSRNAFHEEQRRCPALVPADKWQKRYYTGKDMKNKSALGHQTKLRLKPFVRTVR